MGEEVLLETRWGRVRGRRQDGLAVFQGIPYAAPPVAALRFRPPQAPEPWPGVRDAVDPGRAAPHRAGALQSMLGAREVGWSEDCLSLNVWTPGPDGRSRPVLVWLHGGGFTSGSGSLPLYDGSALARRGDVVVVTLNYRLGILGWLALPALAEEEGGVAGNFGLLDQIAALEWVREHAAALGGDPEQVTLFGESAGGMSIGSLLGCPRARGLFQRAICQSGAAHNVHSAEEAEPVTRMVLEELAVGERDLRRLREIPAEAVLEAQQRVLARPGGRGGLLRFQPVVDGEVLPRHPLEAVADGNAEGVALLAGTNLDEYKLWGLTDGKLAQLDEPGLVRRCLRNVPGEHRDEGPHGERVVRAYREARAGRDDTDAKALWFAIESDRIFRVPAMRLLELQKPHAPAVHAYLFTWASPFLDGALGSCHALEIPFVFGHVDHPALAAWVGSDDDALALSQRMQDAWLAFARGEDLDWHAYETDRRQTRIFGREDDREGAPYETERAFWEGLL
jgi:para-nitrobenzyl esterase